MDTFKYLDNVDNYISQVIENFFLLYLQAGKEK